ncbi:Protein kinase C-like phorbol ester/diacylglycerol-binding domain containing protein [Trema orientale]|uniref:Protein kinase C-like phorbol ester/diacylglycerol-binding domain containing protein n=1 Tax=Trema orientale TaxID=63057 RepID=A0A2P5F4E3_TREOI|nr:Protein kinase C-like phorbol ester/diacylglycerol-binding domain containing protein [Trema orientale]
MDKIDHPFHPLHPLVRRPSEVEKYWCASCHRYCYFDESFYCSICDFAMDSDCALMEPIECEAETNIQHFSHQHPMPLIEIFSELETCFACKLPCLGSPTYACKRCKYFLHRRCAECPSTNATHPSHPSHNLHLYVDHEKQRTCRSCERNASSFVLSCSKCDNWNVCIECYLLPIHVYRFYFHSHHHDHPNVLTRLVSKKSAEFTCSLCHFTFKTGASRFECRTCGFVIDVDCALRPSITVEGSGHFRHIYHQHPMMLVVDDARGKGVDQCCFACHSPCESGVAYFSCTECKCFIHKSCAELPLKFEHALHKNHSLFLTSPDTKLVTYPLDENLPSLEIIQANITAIFVKVKETQEFVSITVKSANSLPTSTA